MKHEFQGPCSSINKGHCIFCTLFNDDETLPNFMKRKHPRKGEKKKQGARTAQKRPQGGK
jgi:hypothetical protein